VRWDDDEGGGDGDAAGPPEEVGLEGRGAQVVVDAGAGALDDDDDGDPAPVEEPPAPPEPPPADGACTEDDTPTPNAGLAEPPGLDGCPDGMAALDDATCMDRWEAFLVVLGDGGEELPFSPFAHPGGALVVAKSAPGAVPQGYISGVEAGDACARAGKRLCSDAEWTHGCRGDDARAYPYGDTREPGVCNDARGVHPAVEYFGTSASWIWSELGHPCINQQDDTVALTGSHAGCVDESGRFFDLMGNLHEWIDDPAGTFRGGFFVPRRVARAEHVRARQLRCDGRGADVRAGACRAPPPRARGLRLRLERRGRTSRGLIGGGQRPRMRCAISASATKAAATRACEAPTGRLNRNAAR
jgi:hypothetical protein